MRIGVLGINYKSSELALREVLAKICQYQFSNLDVLAQRFFCVVLSTCNRTEIYFSAEDLSEAHIELLSYLRQEISESFEHKLYTYFGRDCFFHLASVTSGLDSLLVGESEIQGQVKKAYETATLYYSLPSCIHYLFQKSLHIGKQIRSYMQGAHIPNVSEKLDFRLSENSKTGSEVLQNPSLRYAGYKQKSLPGFLFETSQHLFNDIRERSIFFIGNSEINRKTIGYFRSKRCKNLMVCTRSFAHAKDLCEKYEVALSDWSQLDMWKMYDIVICGTNHHEYIIKSGDLKEGHLKTRLIFDLSMPRTVDPLLNQNSYLTLFNIEQLGKLLENKKGGDQQGLRLLLERVLNLVDCHVEIFHRREKRGVLLNHFAGQVT